jgi:hypothetical protein
MKQWRVRYHLIPDQHIDIFIDADSKRQAYQSIRKVNLYGRVISRVMVSHVLVGGMGRSDARALLLRRPTCP